MNERPALAHRVARVAREEGFRGLWWRSLSATAYRRLVIAARAISDAPPAAEASMELEFEPLLPAGIPGYLRLRSDQSAEQIERRLASEQRCVLVRHQGEIVSARWFTIATAELEYLGLRFELPERTAYVYDVFTAPAARKRGISAQTRGGYEQSLRRLGVEQLLGSFMPENTAGLALVEGAGYRAVGSVGCVRLPGVRIPVRRLPPGYLGRSERIPSRPGG